MSVGKLPVLVVLLTTLAAAPALAECFDWPLRRGDGNRIVLDADSIYVALPGLPSKLASVTVQVRGVVAPRTVNGECLEEKKRGIAARNYALKLLSTAKVKFCDPHWEGETNRIVAGVTIDGHDFGKALIDKGYARAVTADSKKSGWCIK